MFQLIIVGIIILYTAYLNAILWYMEKIIILHFVGAVLGAVLSY